MDIVSKADKEKIEAQLAECISMRKVISERIAEARAQGDLRENADYHAAREDQGHNEAKIRELEAKLARVHVAGDVAVHIGPTVSPTVCRIPNSWQILSSASATSMPPTSTETTT